MSDSISRQDAIDALKEKRDSAKEWYEEASASGDEMMSARAESAIMTFVECLLTIKKLPSAQPEWNNHTVACLLAELFDDPCACNYNGIDEWLPEKCEVIDACPNPVGVACWEQYLKHRAERRTDEGD